jgi:branched-subunit amino acid transport protein
MSESRVLFTIFLMAVVTVLPRMLPIWVLAGRTLPPLVVTWLKYVPVAVLAALLAPELLLREGRIDLSWSNLYFWVSIPAFLIAIKTRSLFLTVMTGMGGIALIRLIL